MRANACFEMKLQDKRVQQPRKMNDDFLVCYSANNPRLLIQERRSWTGCGYPGQSNNTIELTSTEDSHDKQPTEDCKLVVTCKMQNRNATDKLNPQCSKLALFANTITVG